MDQIKQGISLISGILQKHYQRMVDDYNQKQKQQLLLQQAQSAVNNQLILQQSLGKVLMETSILPILLPIKHPSDLIIDGYEYVNGKVLCYNFRWMKKNTDKIAVSHLRIGMNKINNAIFAETNRLKSLYQSLDDVDKMYFINNYPAFYRGFYVVAIKDDVTDVILSVVVN